MDATNDRSHGRHRRRWRLRPRRHRQRHGRHRSQSSDPEGSPTDPQVSSNDPLQVPANETPEPPPRSVSLPTRFCEFVENKMGLPPPYEQTSPNPAPPPSYFGDNPPPPPGMVIPNAPPRTTVITNPPTTSSPPLKLGPGRTGITCPTCNKPIVTRVDFVPNNRTHIVSAALCVLAACCCGCFIPYCMKSCKTANHYCPQCKAFIGSYVPS